MPTCRMAKLGRRIPAPWISINFGTILGPLKWDLFCGGYETMQIYGHFQGNFPYDNALFGLVIFMTRVQNRLFGF